MSKAFVQIRIVNKILGKVENEIEIAGSMIVTEYSALLLAT